MNFVLLSTPACVKCKALKEWLPEFCESKNITLNEVNAFDSKGKILVDTYKLTQVPVLFLYDELGNLIKMFQGDMYRETLENFIDTKQVIS